MSLLDSNILKVLSIWQSDAFLILDDQFKILYANTFASDNFGLTEDVDNLLEYFETDSAENIEKLLEQLFDKNEPIKILDLELTLKNKKYFSAELTLNKVMESGQIFILCVITPNIYSINLRGESRLKTTSVNIEDILKSEKINEIIKKITNLYPLTFIGKEIIYRLVNELEEFFWMKDNKGHYLIVNNSFASSLGLSSKQMEGKYYQNYVPQFLINFFNAIDAYIKETQCLVVLEGNLFPIVERNFSREFIEFPLADRQGNIVAMIGISRKITLESNEKTLLSPEKNLFSIMQYFPGPFALITNKGVLENCNEEFSKLFQKKNIQLREIHFNEIFPPELNKRINDFLNNSQSDGIVIDINETLTIVNSNESDYKLSLAKYYREKNQFAGFSIFLRKNNYYESLQQIVKSKGRMFEILIKNNPSPIFIYDKENLSFLEVNESALKLYGYTREEFLQMDLTDLYSPEDIQTLLSTSDKVSESSAFSKPFRHRKKDGESLLVEISKKSFKFNDRDAEFNLVRDLTDSIEQNKKIQLFKNVFDNTSNVVLLTDPEGIITFANGAAEKLFQISERELLKTSLTSHCADDNRSLLNSTLFQSHPKENQILSVRIKSGGNKLIETELTASPVLDFNSEVESYSIIIVPKISDDGSSIQTKEIIKEVVKEVIVEKPADSRVSAEKQLDPNFLSGVFHEILTPLNVILGFAQELTEGSENMTLEQKEAAEIINQNRFTLLSTMNSIIEFSDIYIKKSKLDINEIGITEVIEQLDKNIRDITGSHKIDFAYGKISSSLRFNTDKKVFESFVNNLVRMVSKLTKENKVYFSAYSQDENYFLISVSDKYGSSSELLEGTFKQLFLESRDPKELGVSKLSNQIIRSLLQSLQGRFTSFTNENYRKEFGFVFPVNPEIASVPEIKHDTIDLDIKSPEESVPPEEEIIHEEIELDLESNLEDLNIPDEPERFTIPETLLSETVEEEIVKENIVEEEIVDENIVDEIVQQEILEPIKEEVIQPVEEVDIVEVQLDEPEITLEPKVKTKPAKELKLSELNCLYIEDQVDSQILFKVQMKGLKDIKFAASFEEALPLLDSYKFDFIVMDINLQGEYNGLDALKIIHKMPGLENVPIVAVTAYVLPGDKEKFIATGFNDFISKPIFREKMVESLNKIFVN